MLWNHADRMSRAVPCKDAFTPTAIHSSEVTGSHSFSVTADNMRVTLDHTSVLSDFPIQLETCNMQKNCFFFCFFFCNIGDIKIYIFCSICNMKQYKFFFCNTNDMTYNFSSFSLQLWILQCLDCECWTCSDRHRSNALKHFIISSFSKTDNRPEPRWWIWTLTAVQDKSPQQCVTGPRSQIYIKSAALFLLLSFWDCRSFTSRHLTQYFWLYKQLNELSSGATNKIQTGLHC